MLGNVVPVNMVIRDKLHPQCIVEDAVGINRSLIQSRKVIISCFCFGLEGVCFHHFDKNYRERSILLI